MAAQSPHEHVRMDSESDMGMSAGMVKWMQAPPSALNPPSQARPTERKQLGYVQQPVSVPQFELTTTNSKLEPGIRGSYGRLPFRALEEDCLPAAIQQRWEASVAASKSAEWRLWFRTLDKTKQKAVVQSLSMKTRDKFWAGLWLEYEEWSEPGHTQHVAAAARAQVILEGENIRRQMEEARRAWGAMAARSWRLDPSEYIPPKEYIELLSAPITPQNILSLKLRLAPSYFRLPNNAFRFATQIFRGKSYKEAVAEQKANFNSWVRENQTRRVEGQPDFVVWGNISVHKDAIPKFTPKKNQPPTGKRRYQKKKRKQPVQSVP